MVSKRRSFKRRVVFGWPVNQLRYTIFFLYTFLFCSSLPISCFAKDTITVDTFLRDDPRETLVSAGGRFELGFFSPESSCKRRYVGIWYYKSHPPIVVWVANRNNPLSDCGGVLRIVDFNLTVLDRTGKSYWSPDLDRSLLTRPVAKLMDSGNLVLRNDQSVKILWQSFEHLTDTFLSGMKMDENLKLISWTSHDDPATGSFTFKLDEEGFLITKNVDTYWRSEKPGNFFTSDDQIMHPAVAYLLSNFSRSVRPNSNDFHLNLAIRSPLDYNNTRLVMNFSGEIRYWGKEKMTGWYLIWGEPRDRCSVFKACGSFGSCNSNNRPECKCLPGFVPSSPDSWKSGDFSGGCTRKSGICDKLDTFISLKMMKVSRAQTQSTVSNKTECMKGCIASCQCQAYSYEAKDNPPRGDPATCWIWTEPLYNLQEEYTVGGHDVYTRVTTSDIELTERNCETCGTNIIPYPLSTKPDCGDPKYYSFHCDDSTGQVSFNALSGTYRVSKINPDSQSFIIQVKNVDNCDTRNSTGIVLQLNQSLPFNVTPSCKADLTNSSLDISSKIMIEIEISWAPPPEPTCSSSEDCKDWPSSSCNLTRDGNRRCLCNAKFRWNSTVLNCTQESGYQEQPGRASGGIRKKPLTSIIVAAVASLILLSCMIVYLCIWLKKKAKKQGNREDAALQLYDSERRIKDLIDSGQFNEDDRKDVDLPLYEFESILAATDNFSEANMLGKGGFGPVYKGKFSGGQEIAVKRLSSASGQGLEEFKNEVVLIARLQHRNLVRLLGYCIRGDEKILLYEYMPNKSLDFFIFDQSQSVLLNWEMRFNIILGIARGLLYLHQDSRLRIIHRDLKTSNILLDLEMNPKISDFGLARMFEGKQTEGNTSRVVGTYGYMSPEYALDGFFSVKSDVFSFGVVVLEIISGKRNTGFYRSKEAMSLLGHTWRSWQEDKALDLMDQTLSASCNRNEFLKCVNVGLLCVQEDPGDRPNMANVVIMLSSETASLAIPKQPAFVLRRGPYSTASSSSKPETNTEITVSFVGR